MAIVNPRTMPSELNTNSQEDWAIVSTKKVPACAGAADAGGGTIPGGGVAPVRVGSRPYTNTRSRIWWRNPINRCVKITQRKTENIWF